MMDTSIWEARAGHRQAAMHQLQWPSLLVLSLIWITECFLLPPTCLASHDLWDTQICSLFGIMCSLGRAHKPAAPPWSLGTFGHVNLHPRQPRLKWGLCPGAATLFSNIISGLRSQISSVSQHLEMSFPNVYGMKTPVKAEEWQSSPPIL